MSKLLSRAKGKYENVENHYYKISIDDFHLDECCFNIQQCIELCLKYIVELNGEQYVENHDIRAQLNKLKTLNVKLPFEEQIRKHASTLNGWEAETRYNDDFTALIEDVDELKKLAKDLINYADSLVKEKQ